jgi:Holliday junction resolvase RusA-like endonuclease
VAYRSTWLIIDGINPEPWTAPEASVGRRSGSNYVQMHKTESLRAYQEAIPEVLREQNPRLESFGEEEIELAFFFWRRLDDYEVGDGKKSRRSWADATNMQKALEDALQGILFDNDRTVRSITSEVMAQGPDVEPRILIHASTYWGTQEWITQRAASMAILIPRIEPRSNVIPEDNLF